MMTKPRGFISLAAVALGTILLITGCVQEPTPAPSASHSQKPTPTPDPTYSPIGKPGSVAPPTTQDEAWVGATNTVKDFLAVQYEIERDTGANADRIDPFATGIALSNVKQVAAQLAEKKITTTGAPVWTPNAAASSFGTLTPMGGTAIPNGIAYIRGCFDVSGQTAKYADGSPAPVSATRVIPVQLTVQYSPDLKSWLVNNEVSILGQSGAPSC